MSKNDKPELDTERPHIIIGYKKGTDDEVVTQCGGGVPDKFETAAMLTHAQAINTLPLINEARELNRLLAENKAQELQNMKKTERKPKQAKKTRENKTSKDKEG